MPNGSDAPRRILVIFNPAAGRNRRRALARVLDALRARNCRVELVETAAPGDAERMARAADPDRFDVIAAAGGDGTINEIVNGLAGRTLALGVIPLGTANVVADDIGLARTPDAIAAALARGAIRDIRVGRANGRRFVMMAGIGFDANVVQNVSLNLKKRIGPLAYVWQALRQAGRHAYRRADARLDGQPRNPVSVVVCNGRRYGGPFIAAPQASLADDTFHVVLMNGRGWFSLVRYGVGLMLGALRMWRDVEIVPARDIVIDGPADEPVQADGDIIARLPVRIVIDPEPVRLVYPA